MKVAITGLVIDGHQVPINPVQIELKNEYLTLSIWNQTDGTIHSPVGLDLLHLLQKNGWKISGATVLPPKAEADEKWVIEFTSPDPALTFTNAYANRQEAIQAATAFISVQAEEELDGTEWDEPEAPALLNRAIEAIAKGALDDAVEAWLEYQDEFDPSEKIALGPSGQTSGRALDFHKEGP